jgi:signal transduction histidine kinase
MRPRSVRARITITAAVSAAIVLSGLAFVLTRTSDARLTRQVDDQLSADRELISRLIQQRVAAGATDISLSQAGPVDRVVQILDRDGAIVSASATGRDRPPLLTKPLPWNTGSATQVIDRTDPLLDQVRVSVSPSPSGADQWLVIARSTEQIHQSTRDLERTLLIVVPMLIALVAALVWVVVGRALRPVEAIRHSVRDITSRDLSQRVARPQTGDEIDRLAATMNEMLARLETAAQHDRQLVADASHELRSPLASAYALLETRPTDAQRGREHDRDALAALDRLRVLIDQLFELSVLDSSSPPPNRPVDLDVLVLQHANVVRRTTNLTVDTSHVSAGQVLGSKDALGRMVDNVLTNAARHAATTIRLDVCENDNEVLFAVSDDGPGIPAEDRERVFDRFTRLPDNPASDRSGAGLGLAIVASIVDRHRGTVRAENTDNGSGVRIRIVLPKAENLIVGASADQ